MCRRCGCRSILGDVCVGVVLYEYVQEVYV